MDSLKQKISDVTEKACLCKRAYDLDCITKSKLEQGTCDQLDCSDTNMRNVRKYAVIIKLNYYSSDLIIRGIWF